MTIYRGLVTQSGIDTATELVVTTGLCCAVPFQVIELNAAWFEIENRPIASAASQVRISVQSKSGHQSLESVGLLAVRTVSTTIDLLADMAQVILPVQSTTGDIIVRIESANTLEVNEAHFVIDVSFKTLKELEYMRLVASGY